MAPQKTAADDESLKRLGGGRWQTRDERFTIEPESGTWVVVDSEQTDDLGLPLVRGPFSSLTAAKAAIATARTSQPATSPLAGRVARGSAAPEPSKTSREEPARRKTSDDGASRRATEARPRDETRPRTKARAAAEPPEPGKPRERSEPPTEPDWIADLAAGDRGRARRLIAALTGAGVPDAEGIVRRDLAGDVAAVAAVAVLRRLEALGDGAAPRDVAAAVAEGRDDELGVRWRLVDGEGRPIVIEAPRKKRPR
jgi:hypothetical protein